MDASEIEAFLTLAEELHFDRTAERLRLSQSRVSRLIASLERRSGAQLFERTSRHVALTPPGQRLRDRISPAWDEINAAFQDVREDASSIAGTLRLGWPVSVGGPALSLLTETFSAGFPACGLAIRDVALPDVYGPLRRGEIDVLVYWQAGNDPDLTAGPVVEYRDRVLAVGREHRLAGRESVPAEDLAHEDGHAHWSAFPAAVFDALFPPVTPSGRPIPRTVPWQSLEDAVMQIAHGRVVHPTVAGASFVRRDDIRLVPIRDLPPLPLGLIWCTANENARIRALAGIARRLAPPRSMPDGHGSLRETLLVSAPAREQARDHVNREGTPAT